MGRTFHVFHFIGHGSYADGEGHLILTKDDGRASYVTGERLGQMLTDRRTLRLAVLNACEGAMTTPTDPLAGVATALVANTVPAVIGMQFAITDAAAITFSEEFYAALADGYPVDMATTEARRAIAAEDHVQWATPVLFMRVADGRLFDVTGQGEQQSTAGTVSNEGPARATDTGYQAPAAQADSTAQEMPAFPPLTDRYASADERAATAEITPGTDTPLLGRTGQASPRLARLIGVALLGAVMIGGAVAYLQLGRSHKPATATVRLDAEQMRGRELFTRSCASCHTLAAAGATGHIGPNLDVRVGENVYPARFRKGRKRTRSWRHLFRQQRQHLGDRQPQARYLHPLLPGPRTPPSRHVRNPHCPVACAVDSRRLTQWPTEAGAGSRSRLR